MDFFYIIVVLVIAVVLGGWYVWEKGLLGTATEGRLKAMRAEIAAKLKHEIEVLDQKIEAKVAARLEKAPTTEAPPSPTLSPTPVPTAPAAVESRDKATRLAENRALLGSGAITREEYDAAQIEILKS